MNSEPLLQLQNLKKYFQKKNHWFSLSSSLIKAVDNISFSVNEGEIVGLVGESGSGKTSTGLMIEGLSRPTEGAILFQGENLLTLKGQKKRFLKRQIQMVFQNPYSSLNPRKTVFQSIGDPLLYHGLVKNKTAQMVAVLDVLNAIGLSKNSVFQYPHQFSGGQQQRISIGRAIALKPKLLICDEIVSALDMSVQAQVLNLLMDLQQNLRFGCLFISHNLAVIKHLCSKVLIMYQGKIVEQGDINNVFKNPQHPYTKLLLASQAPAHPSQRSR
ncbi:ATP-binding cassette domain-containing protein [Candidatus Clavichlamydia salmonicola]|uniref:ATP-binding cassette domain-containing protein n=1 Tax=Candidatus Clavichlamydia salmonicola TaxID=469812 RepID=UPI001891A86E|nr:ATP-binding cassette domain-containing protein [Candidatus Clavichlamydia salmonicola]